MTKPLSPTVPLYSSIVQVFVFINVTHVLKLAFSSFLTLDELQGQSSTDV